MYNGIKLALGVVPPVVVRAVPVVVQCLGGYSQSLSYFTQAIYRAKPKPV
jgi:hypothetical protein